MSGFHHQLAGGTYNLESLDVVFACSHLEQILREISDCLVQLLDIDAVISIRPPRLHALPCASPVILDHGLLGVVYLSSCDVRTCGTPSYLSSVRTDNITLMEKLLII